MDKRVYEASHTPRGRCWFIYLSFCLHGILVAGLIATAIYLNGRITQGLKEMKEEISHHRSGLTKRSTGPPPAHGLLQQKLPGMEALQLVGIVPMIRVSKNGTIGPWRSTASQVSWASLSSDGIQVSILEDGLYFVYAQVFYLTEETSNSFEITRLRPSLLPKSLKAQPSRETLTVCANQATSKNADVGGATEVSCYTGIVSSFLTGDKLTLYQIEQHRVILFSNGYSHWGIIKLQGDL